MKTEFRFNGDAKLLLTPENEDDRKLLDLAFNGKIVRSIKDAPENGIALILSKPEPVAAKVDGQ